MSLCLDMSMVSQPHTEQGVMKGVLTLLYHSQHFIGATWAFLWKTGWHLLPTCITGPQFYLINIIGKVVECSQNSWTAVDFLYLFAKPLWQSKSLSFSPVVHVPITILPSLKQIFVFPFLPPYFPFFLLYFFFSFNLQIIGLAFCGRAVHPVGSSQFCAFVLLPLHAWTFKPAKPREERKKKKRENLREQHWNTCKNVTEKYKHMLVWISGHIKQQSQ